MNNNTGLTRQHRNLGHGVTPSSSKVAVVWLGTLTGYALNPRVVYVPLFILTAHGSSLVSTGLLSFHLPHPTSSVSTGRLYCSYHDLVADQRLSRTSATSCSQTGGSVYMTVARLLDPNDD